MNTTIKNYIRQADRTPVGVVVMVKTDNGYRFGYSLCAPNDKFNKERGTKIATNRALTGQNALPDLEDRKFIVSAAFDHLAARGRKYFENSKYSQG